MFGSTSAFNDATMKAVQKVVAQLIANTEYEHEAVSPLTNLQAQDTTYMYILDMTHCVASTDCDITHCLTSTDCDITHCLASTDCDRCMQDAGPLLGPVAPLLQLK